MCWYIYRDEYIYSGTLHIGRMRMISVGREAISREGMIPVGGIRVGRE